MPSHARNGAGSRDRLIDAAGRLFQLKGYRAAVLEEILDLARVGRSNFYYHFSGKEQLGLAVLDRWAAEFEEEMIRACLENGDLAPADRLEAFLQATRRRRARNRFRGGCPFGTLATELADEVESVRQKLSGFFRRVEESLQAVIQQGITSGSFRTDLDAAGAASHVVSAMEGMTLLARTHRSLDPWRRGIPHLLAGLGVERRITKKRG
jgi:TetR/AcrR family transcriptional repressor of nem operon